MPVYGSVYGTVYGTVYGASPGGGGSGGATAAEILAVFKADTDFGTTGLILNAATAATQATAARNLAEADVVLELDAGVYKQKTLQRGTSTELIPDKIIKQPSGNDLTNPATQRFGGAAQEPV